jgi:hypothetical protein
MSRGSHAVVSVVVGFSVVWFVAVGFGVVSVVMLVGAACAQDAATGALRGDVVDPSGGRVAQASIVAVNLATGQRYSAVTDAEGRFAFDLLPPGDYSARATAKGMSPQVTPQLHVDVGGIADLEFRLTILGAQESVTVSDAPALVDTQSSSVSTVLDERALADIPLNGRRFSDLALLSPGVTQDPRSLTSSTNGDLSFGGIRGFQNSFLVDGATSTTASSRRLADFTALPTRCRRKWCRSFAFPPMPTEWSWDAPAEL